MAVKFEQKSGDPKDEFIIVTHATVVVEVVKVKATHIEEAIQLVREGEGGKTQKKTCEYNLGEDRCALKDFNGDTEYGSPLEWRPAINIGLAQQLPQKEKPVEE